MRESVKIVIKGLFEITFNTQKVNLKRKKEYSFG